MRNEDTHLQDDDLLLVIDGEMPEARLQAAQAHLACCWSCRARKQQLENAIVEYVQIRDVDQAQPPGAEGARALLRAHLAETETRRHNELRQSPIHWAAAAGVTAAAVFLISIWLPAVRNESTAIPIAAPKRSLTPGAVLVVGKDEVCLAQPDNNRQVPSSLRRQVLAEYGIRDTGSQAYEIDYLITPALGGADDIHNLWPQSYGSTEWNAHVKDALEERLRDLVCQGRLDLESAQREIAGDWIAAYKKYFHTEVPH